MFADEMRRAIAAAPRVKLPELSAALWKAYAAEMVTEEEATSLSEAVEARKVVKAPICTPKPRHGSRPRSPASMERRRRWVSSGWLPPALASRFTLGEAAVLAVVASEVSRSGRCTLPLGAIAALAGVGKTTVRSALHQARALGLLHVQARPVRAFRSDTNVVTILSAEWRTWLAVGRKGGGSRTPNPTKHPSILEGVAVPRAKGLSMRPAFPGSTSLPKGPPRASEARWRAFDERRHLNG